MGDFRNPHFFKEKQGFLFYGKGRKMFGRFMLIPLASIFFHISFSFGGTIQLPQTGQTKCYDSLGAEITCAGTGQDGEIKSGVAWPNPRFTAGTGGETDCLTDNLTGLTWVRSPDSTTRTWQGALDYAKNLTLCGHSDWRLPNVNEFESLAHAGQVSLAQWLNDPVQGFSNIQFSDYWSSTSYAYSTPHAWLLDVLSNEVGSSDKQNPKYTLPVRGTTQGLARVWKTGQGRCFNGTGGEITCMGTGQDGETQSGADWPNPRFINIYNGTVTDRLTGLMWLQNGNCIQTRYPNFDTDVTAGDGKVSWQHALDFVKGINTGIYPECGVGYTNWRLPNVHELRSLADYDQEAIDEWLIAQGFMNVQRYGYWTSTTDPEWTTGAYEIMMYIGGPGSYQKSTDWFVWPVRDVVIYNLFLPLIQRNL